MRLARNFAMTYAHMGDNELRAGRIEPALREYRKALAIAQTRSAADPKDGEAHATLAEYYRRFGELYQTQANRPGISISERRAYWQNARSWFEEGLKNWAEIREHFAMSDVDKQKLEQARKNVQACDTALSQLRGADSDQIRSR